MPTGPVKPFVFVNGQESQSAETLVPLTAGTVGPPNRDGLRAKLRVASPAGRNLDAVRVDPGKASIAIRALEVEIIGSVEAAAIKCYGKLCSVYNVRQVGTGLAIRIGGEGSPTGTEGLVADLVYSDTGKGDYAIGAFGEYKGQRIWSKNCTFRRFAIWIASGKHALRAEHSDHLYLGDEKLILPELADAQGHPLQGFAGPLQTGFAFTARYTRPVEEFGGCALAINDGIKPTIKRGFIEGKCAFGPLNIWHAHPDWILDGATIDQCQILGQIIFNAGAVGTQITNSVIRVKPTDSCLGIGGQSGPFPATNGTIANTKFYGAHLCDPNARALFDHSWKIGADVFLNDKRVTGWA